MAPWVGSSNPPIIRSEVVLPQPEGPSRLKNSPRSISSVRSSTAVTSANRLVTRSSRTSMSAKGAPFVGGVVTVPDCRTPAGVVAMSATYRRQEPWGWAPGAKTNEPLCTGGPVRGPNQKGAAFPSYPLRFVSPSLERDVREDHDTGFGHFLHRVTQALPAVPRLLRPAVGHLVGSKGGDVVH